ncbi:MAG: prepilin-type N-terminal cleavage/methylation domain-containing protein [Candidatus Omnitrophica bacterium]|nr:prepilin-type N-terminal cleavage/methylation domain-containing protein [Candidatus Omnitrophota bacterium]
MKSKKGITLVELIVAVVLVAVLIFGVSVVESSFYKMKTGTLDKQLPAIQGNLALATIFERVLRSGSPNNTLPAFTISADSKTLEFKRGGVTESFYLDGGDLKYNDGKTVKVILRNVKSVQFSKDVIKANTFRLIAEIDLASGDNFRTSVMPRNQFTPGTVIN